MWYRSASWYTVLKQIWLWIRYGFRCDSDLNLCSSHVKSNQLKFQSETFCQELAVYVLGWSHHCKECHYTISLQWCDPELKYSTGFYFNKSSCADVCNVSGCYNPLYKVVTRLQQPGIWITWLWIWMWLVKKLAKILASTIRVHVSVSLLIIIGTKAITSQWHLLPWQHNNRLSAKVLHSMSSAKTKQRNCTCT